ncbi:MAG: PQQ-dependent sugar dehydrogenase [Bacteroidia bacterium]|nr:PQQ-dependent sugar dehydrogenase [Bacteroidia bacterium]
MKHVKFAAIVLFSLFFVSASCVEQKSNSNDDSTPPTEQGPETGTLPPVEDRQANTDYKPAFEGQTRIAGVKTETAYDVKVISSDLTAPWAVTALPDGRLAITQKAGTMRIATTEGQLSEEITGFPSVDDRRQGGLLDVKPAPDFESSRMLYFTFAERTSQGSLTAVGKGKLSADETKIEDFQVIFRAVPYYDNSMHFGSRIVFDKNGNIFVSTGERSDLETRPKAQLLDNGYGKVIHITPDGKPVEGNPFINTDGALPEIYSYGHRNAQGLDIHPATGELWLSEMGPRGGDELNLVKPGKNYGWAAITYGIEYNGQIISGGATQQEGMEQPVYYWDPVLSPSGMAFYASNAIPEWENNLFIGGLNSKHIARIVLKDNKVVGEERLLANENQRFRDVGMGNDGALYAVTDEGRLYRISKK